VNIDAGHADDFHAPAKIIDDHQPVGRPHRVVNAGAPLVHNIQAAGRLAP